MESGVLALALGKGEDISRPIGAAVRRIEGPDFCIADQRDAQLPAHTEELEKLRGIPAHLCGLHAAAPTSSHGYGHRRRCERTHSLLRHSRRRRFIASASHPDPVGGPPRSGGARPRSGRTRK